MGCGNGFHIAPWICNQVLPIVYDGSLSTYEILCKCVDYINKLLASDQELLRAIDLNKQEIETLKAEMQRINEELKKVQDGTYIELYLGQMLTAVEKWVDEHLLDIVGKAVKFVTFGLTPTGRFCAHIPDNWQNLKFSTIMDASSPLYGHLALCY